MTQKHQFYSGSLNTEMLGTAQGTLIPCEDQAANKHQIVVLGGDKRHVVLDIILRVPKNWYVVHVRQDCSAL